MSSPAPGSPLTVSAGSDSDSGQKRKREGGSVNLLENLYGVERRTERPQKAVKVERTAANGTSEQQLQTMAGGFQHSNGVIGKFMREHKDTANGDTSALVDLTNGVYPTCSHMNILISSCRRG